MRTLAAIAAALALQAPAAAPPPGPAPFKVDVRHFAAGGQAIESAVLVADRGRAYWFRSEDTDEVVIYDGADGAIEILDMKAGARTDLTAARLDEKLARLKAALLASAAKRDEAGGRAGATASRMTRDLTEPSFGPILDLKARQLRLANASVEVVASGEVDSDPARRSLFVAALTALAKLDAARDPAALPPFARLEAIAALDRDAMRPTELSLLYRLAGPPKRDRRTYTLSASPSAAELQALARVDLMTAKAAVLRFEKYERRGHPEP